MSFLITLYQILLFKYISTIEFKNINNVWFPLWKYKLWKYVFKDPLFLNWWCILKSPSIISAHFAFILFILTKSTVWITVHRQSTDEKKSHLLSDSEMGWGWNTKYKISIVILIITFINYRWRHTLIIVELYSIF